MADHPTAPVIANPQPYNDRHFKSTDEVTYTKHHKVWVNRSSSSPGSTEPEDANALAEKLRKSGLVPDAHWKPGALNHGLALGPYTEENAKIVNQRLNKAGFTSFQQSYITDDRWKDIPVIGDKD